MKNLRNDKILRLYSVFVNVKQKHNDAVIFVRNDDEYILYSSDAEIAAKVLNLETSAFICEGDKISTASFNVEDLDYCLPKLIRSCYRIAIV